MISEINLTPTSSEFNIPQGEKPIFARSWGNAADSKAVALLIHGLGAHSGWFEALGTQLELRRVYCVSYDQIGFGKRRQEKFRTYLDWIDDLVRVFDYVKTNAGDKPIYLMGNSMGGLLSLVAADRISANGLVLFSPGFDGYPDTFTMAYRVITVIKALVRPEMEVAVPYTCDMVTRDIAARIFMENDPERRFCVPGRMLLELLKLSQSVMKKHHDVKCPVLMLTAGKDRIVNNIVNQAFFAKLTAPKKTQKQFPEAWHDLMFDPVIDEVADQIDHWLSEHTVERLITG